MSQISGGQHGIQYRNTIIPLALSFLVAFISLSMKNIWPRLTFCLIALLASWASIHPHNFPFGSDTNSSMPPIIFMFIAYQFYLHCILSPGSLETERMRHASSRDKPHKRESEKAMREEDSSSSRQFISSRNWHFGYYMLWNARLINTPWEAPGIRPQKHRVESKVAKESADVPAMQKPVRRWSFIWRRSLALLFRFLALCVYWDPDVYHYMPGGKPWRSSDFSSPNRFMLLMLLRGQGEIIRATLIRLYLLLDMLMTNYFTTSAQHGVLAIFAVAIHLDEPEDWPYLYGSILEAYTVRRYWGRFWHLLIYRSFSAMAELFSSNVLKLRDTHPAARYLKNAQVFVISGFMHLAVEWIVEPDVCRQCGCAWAMGSYIWQILAIVMEELFQRLIVPRWIWKSKNAWVRSVCKTIGYMWVICWNVLLLEVDTFPFEGCRL